MGKMIEDYGQKFIKKIRSRMIYQNKNWLSIICGETGSGKSYSALSLANMISPRGIKIKYNVVFNPIQFLNKINNSKGLIRGDILVFDEAGVGMAARDWYSIQNKLLGAVLQTFRNMNIGVIFTTPNLSFIDIQARKLFHNYFETANIDYEEEIAYIKLYEIQHNSRYDKTYYKHPRFTDKHGKKIVCSHLAIPKPNEELIRDYEKVKSKYTQELNLRALEELVTPKDKNTKMSRMQETKEVKQSLKKNYKKYLKKRGNREYLDIDLIKSDYKIAHHRAMSIKKDVERTLEL